MHRVKLVFIISLFISHLLQAQKDKDEDSMPLLRRQDSTSVGKEKKIKFTPFLAPALSPEVGLMLTGGGLISFTVDRSDKLLQPSSIPFSFGYSTTGAANLNIRPSIFFKNDKNRVTGDIWMKDMPDNYWGVGYDAAKRPAQPDSTTAYWRNWWQVNLKYVHQFRDNFFGGTLIDFNRTKATSLSPQMLADPNVSSDGTSISNWSVGLLLQYDSRDLTVNAYEGVFVELSSNFYRSDGFGKPKYQVIVLDYRQYKQIKRPGNTLAWQVKTRIGNGDVPWPELSQIGTPFDLRGYRWGRYRDKNMLFGIIEYRYMFMRKTPRKDGNMMSRFGVVPWLATGSIANKYVDMTNWLPNAGLGLRIEIQKRMNARIDFGIGNDTNAFYISFNEAF